MRFLSRVFALNGRIGRGAFWLMILPWLAAHIAIAFTLWTDVSPSRPTGLAKLVYDTITEALNGMLEGNSPLVPTLFVIVAFLLFLSACVRRLRDLGKSQLLILVVFWPALFSLGMQALNLFGIDINRYLAPAPYPFLFYSFMIAATALALWQLVLFFQMAFVRGRQPLEESPQLAQQGVTPQRV